MCWTTELAIYRITCGLLGEDGAVTMMVLTSATSGHLMLRTHLFPLFTTGDSSSEVAVSLSRLDSRGRLARKSLERGE